MKTSKQSIKDKSFYRATHLSYTKSRIKSFIVYMAVYGLISISLAEWLIRVGGLRHEKTS